MVNMYSKYKQLHIGFTNIKMTTSVFLIQADLIFFYI